MNAQETGARRALESSPVRFLIATAIAVPLVFGGIQGARFFTEYRQASWYSELADWFDRQAEDARQEAEAHIQRADGSPACDQAFRWRSEANELLAVAVQHERQSAICRARAQHWGTGWFTWRPQHGLAIGKPDRSSHGNLAELGLRDRR